MAMMESATKDYEFCLDTIATGGVLLNQVFDEIEATVKALSTNLGGETGEEYIKRMRGILEVLEATKVKHKAIVDKIVEQAEKNTNTEDIMNRATEKTMDDWRKNLDIVAQWKGKA